MSAGLNRLLAAAVITGAAIAAVLAAPSAALACSGGPSAVNVYKECLQNGGGGQSTGGGGGGPSTGGGNQTGVNSTPPLSSQASKAISRAGKDSRTLAGLVRTTGPQRRFHPDNSGPAAATEPTALGSAFDLGSGPTALLIVLAGTAVLLLAATGVRGWRRSHRPQ
jgi:hypothetical protein